MTTVCPCNNGTCNCHKNEWFCICQDWCKPTKEYQYNKNRELIRLEKRRKVK